ncbi:hypothetical protein BU24DRAFT_383106 [Aaosphaeria arxii CBS 175.79]|uniref:RGS domain-containing protein n=1 Tax=Aaosphaeria arxii CBS 175.79 TaxID=1450172 RepID=A0A6A5Y717_9PLEO|nr:uncharacterized protein BU24DRAFT_383106 [Aaosphaeria arxii CBS 175.79]KAF2021076.1 hypothetical protein BU24DRAFT_383106 [Aaosphaeria arxii CBS 175.79]
MALQLDSLAWFFISFAIVWSVLLAAGLLFLFKHRHLPCIQIRRLPLLFTGVLCFHAYGTICALAYVIAPLAPCDAEYWIMNIYLPLGAAMFQAANSQFLHVASRQKQFAQLDTIKAPKAVDEEEYEKLARSRFRRIMRGLERADRIDRMMVFICIGMIVQLLIALFIFFASKKFHPSYGVFDWNVVGSQMEVRMKCSKGWEWWPSLVWQFFWAWIYAPYLLWKSRGIRDVHGWRLQTICCCIAGLPATPLWLAGLYVPQMAVVNQYMVPPTWFAVSIFFVEVFSIGFPVIQVLRSKSLNRETLDAIASWEKRNRFDVAADATLKGSDDSSMNKSDAYSGTTFHSVPNSPAATTTTFNSHKSEMLTMAALENALRVNPDPLLRFAALKDFAGENVGFLVNIAQWKKNWFYTTQAAEDHLREQFFSAVHIYASFVSLETSEFPVNLCSKEMKRLNTIFGPAAAALFLRPTSASSSHASATPFDVLESDTSSTTNLKSDVRLDDLGRSNLRSAAQMSEFGTGPAVPVIQVPEEFTTGVFDAAETEIKYLVLTNTWPKFVRCSQTVENLSNGNVEGDAQRWKNFVLCSK